MYYVTRFIRTLEKQNETQGAFTDWLLANIAPVFKKGSRSDPANYRPISLTSVSCKIMEHVLYSQIMNHLDKNKKFLCTINMVFDQVTLANLN